MKDSTIRIATRQSKLALWQAHHVRDRLLQHHPQLNIELVPIVTQGDRILDRPLAKIGGKGLFIKELQVALLEDRADIAVHSMKDVPIDDVDGLQVEVILSRADPRDVLVSKDYRSIEDLPAQTTVGTSSLRRKSQLKLLRDDLDIVDLRGNVPTRIERMESGEYGAIILAAAGMKRLGLAAKITTHIAIESMLPAVGQGAIGIETRADDVLVRAYVDVLNDADTAVCVLAERALSRELQGSCEIPLAAHAVLANGKIRMSGLVASVAGDEVVSAQGEANFDKTTDAVALGARLGQDLLARGADKIIAAAMQP